MDSQICVSRNQPSDSAINCPRGSQWLHEIKMKNADAPAATREAEEDWAR